MRPRTSPSGILTSIRKAASCDCADAPPSPPKKVPAAARANRRTNRNGGASRGSNAPAQSWLHLPRLSTPELIVISKLGQCCVISCWFEQRKQDLQRLIRNYRRVPNIKINRIQQVP